MVDDTIKKYLRPQLNNAKTGYPAGSKDSHYKYNNWSQIDRWPLLQFRITSSSSWGFNPIPIPFHQNRPTLTTRSRIFPQWTHSQHGIGTWAIRVNSADVYTFTNASKSEVGSSHRQYGYRACSAQISMPGVSECLAYRSWISAGWNDFEASFRKTRAWGNRRSVLLLLNEFWWHRSLFRTSDVDPLNIRFGGRVSGR